MNARRKTDTGRLAGTIDLNNTFSSLNADIFIVNVTFTKDETKKLNDLTVLIVLFY